MSLANVSQRFRLAHLFPIFVAVAHTLGSLVSVFDPEGAIHSFGLPERFAQSPIAHACFLLSGARLSTLGMAQLLFYLRGDFFAVDIIMALLVCVGLVDGFVCWQEGVPSAAIFRATSGLVIGAWGALGLTSKL
ncbi:uncharacterized protein CTRU02_211643 [Colletotrichum truncatum]|uniref:Uncharacterized protein n=1 Tax=Colletotrichum truncatum TaxID=5467 RepID=A0ACC3YL99_COLTU|nr:uncharacterized protein CTRU02_14631 [Colletotrichum truncatum]KAF6781950.1 hypothetical protein CTRU02_14631 [Colletotrichum truncatum]